MGLHRKRSGQHDREAAYCRDSKDWHGHFLNKGTKGLEGSLN
jgi:hypothetical protein